MSSSSVLNNQHAMNRENEILVVFHGDKQNLPIKRYRTKYNALKPDEGLQKAINTKREKLAL